MTAVGYTSGDPRKVNDVGDTMTGGLTLSGGSSNLTVGGSGTVSGNIDVHGSTSALPYGYGTSARLGLSIASSYPSDDVNGGTDGTGRINLYSYQRANVSSFGENIRHFIMRSDAKTMEAFYVPVQTADSTGGYDPTSRDVKSGGVTWKPVVWQGAHYEANAHNSVHGHWELEVADSTGALQGRLEIPFIDQSKGGGYGASSGQLDGARIGIDYTNIRTNLADFSIRAQNIISGDYSGQSTCLRIGGNNTVPKDIRLSISSDMLASGDRWKIRANTDSESGSNAGTNFQLLRCADDGTQLGTALLIQRSDGQIVSGATAVKSARWAAVWGTSGIHGFSAQPSATIGSAAAFDGQLSGTTERGLQLTVTGDASRRYVVQADGKTEWGDGTASRDTNLYRSAANTLKTDDSLAVGVDLDVIGRALGIPVPATHGMIAWNGDPTQATNAVAPTSGTIYLHRVDLPRATTTAKLWYILGGTLGSGVTSAEMGLYNSSGTRLGSVDISSAIASGSNAPKSADLAVAVTPGMYWVAFVINASTMPTLCRSNAVTAGQNNINLTASTARFAVNGTGATLPASITPGSNDAGSNARSFWVGVS